MATSISNPEITSKLTSAAIIGNIEVLKLMLNSVLHVLELYVVSFLPKVFVWRPSFIVELCPSLSRGTCCPTVTVTKVGKKLQYTYISTC